MILKVLLALCLGCLPFLGYAEESVPQSCKKWDVSDDKIRLQTKKPVLVLLNNISASDLWLVESSGLSSRLEPGRWSAVLVDKKKIILSCIESRPGHEQQVACAGMALVYKWQGIKFPDQVKQGFLGENATLSSLISHLRDRGFYLP